MAYQRHLSFMLPFLVLTLSSMISNTTVSEARHLLGSTADLPKVPELPKPEISKLPELQKPKVPKLPKPEVPKVPELPKPEVPKFKGTKISEALKSN
ncbi:hypothetical protein PanWU01x14_350310 [Parasponia andersonii]|uniref:Hydroxyproline-rich glycoprotein family protein n=1 Tax=Parasponia andersonii TaxID=3476 RepID=A0A2P5AB46_PARAD|nr:hypothetical protein PanWU01x14_350310 [Parasponia andersonii]